MKLLIQNVVFASMLYQALASDESKPVLATKPTTRDRRKEPDPRIEAKIGRVAIPDPEPAPEPAQEPAAEPAQEPAAPEPAQEPAALAQEPAAPPALCRNDTMAKESEIA